MWLYRCRFGTFRICPDDELFSLWLDDELLGKYNSAVAAADDVYTHHSGYYEWDKLDHYPGEPTDIHEWTYFDKL